MQRRTHDQAPPVIDGAPTCDDCASTRLRATPRGTMECLGCGSTYPLPPGVAAPEPAAVEEEPKPRKIGFFRALFGRGGTRRERRPSAPSPAARPTRRRTRVTVVEVAYRELWEPIPKHPHGGYSYIWALPTEPTIATRVIVDARGELKAAVIIGFDADPEVPAGKLKRIERLPSDRDLREAQSTAEIMEAWLDTARYKAGLPTRGTTPDRRPRDTQPIPPTRGHATEDDADEYGRAWWQIYKTGQDLDWPEGETDTLHDIADYWFTMRDDGPAVAEAKYVKADQRRRSREAATVRGRHFTGWIPTLNEWRSAGGHDDEALELIHEIIDATERAFEIFPDGGLPPGYTTRAAIIYRRRKDYAAELQVLDRFLALDPHNSKIRTRREATVKKAVGQ